MVNLIPAEVDAFVAEAIALDADDLSEMYAKILRTSGVRPLIRSDALSLAAAPFSALDKRVRDGLRARAEELNGSGTSDTDLSTAITLIMLGARVIWKRSAVPAETYDAIASTLAEYSVSFPR